MSELSALVLPKQTALSELSALVLTKQTAPNLQVDFGKHFENF
jgi:hypothetical protein